MAAASKRPVVAGCGRPSPNFIAREQSLRGRALTGRFRASKSDFWWARLGQERAIPNDRIGFNELKEDRSLLTASQTGTSFLLAQRSATHQVLVRRVAGSAKARLGLHTSSGAARSRQSPSSVSPGWSSGRRPSGQ